MPGLTISKALARKRIAYVDSRLERYPDHPNKAVMLAERKGYKEIVDAPPALPQDRLLTRVETLVAAVRKIDATLEADAKHPNKKRLLERRAAYRTSLENIQEYGREKKPTAPVGVKIDVPVDVLESRSE